MTREQFDILCRPEVRQAIEKHIGDDPAAVAAGKALRRQLAGDVPALVATQVKYLQRARTKLPHYYEARCILPPLSFEQAGSAETAAHKQYGGDACIDLTCGLGVDSANFARRFRRVTAVERDPVLAAVARENFQRLGLHNIEVIEASAGDFLLREGLKADLVYVDPDRRGGDNRKLVLPADCSPDVTALHGRMSQVSGRIVIKTSPLFDHAEALRLFGPHATVEAVSLRGECKELLIETGPHIVAPAVRASVAGGESFSVAAGAPHPPHGTFAPPYAWLIVPDVALRKMRLAGHYFDGSDACVVSDTGYAFARELPPGAMYRPYAIDAVTDLKAMRDLLRQRGIKRLQIMQSGFDMPNAAIARQLGVTEGGTAMAAFTTVDGRRMAVLLK